MGDKNWLQDVSDVLNDNARPHRSRAVTAHLQSEAVTSVPWPAIRPDLNPREHIWDMFGRRETVSRLTNGSCAMSLNSNHVVLSTMPKVIADVGLPTVDV
jgi:hypothetical protein